MTDISESRAFVYTTAFALLCTAIMIYAIDLHWITAIIYAHVGLGSLAFIVGVVPLFSKKGRPLHKNSGKIFYYSMTVSVAISLLVSVLPGHTSPSMLLIAVLSLYFLIGGKRSIQFKNPQHVFTLDRLLAITIITTATLIIGYSVFIQQNHHPLRMVFGGLGIVFGALDLWLYRDVQSIKRFWLFLHLSKMIGGYTAAVTAFFVAQNVLSGYFNWFSPTVIAIIYLIYWAIKKRTFNQPTAKPA